MTSWLDPTRIVATCPRGCAPTLEKELRALGWPGARAVGEDAAEVEGNLADAMRMNLRSRVAGRVLFEVAAFEAETADDLYEGVRELPWEEWIGLDYPMHWRVGGRGPDDARFAALRCKDGVADRMRAKLGRRPDASPGERGAACLSAHWEEGGAT
ncbi:MAG: class I SAM-dependent RNA methyltransferase, partial [Kiritimatiellae bacterium]|nr:class I SAM-dependent RNA methyltransferase [Kiritimatiellia bacterium]